MPRKSSSSSSGGVGNTSSSSTHKKEKKTKQISPAKRWCFTLNNYLEYDVEKISSIVPEFCFKSLVAKEVGECGTPHLQGFVEFFSKKRPKSVFNYTDRINWRLANGDDQSQADYIGVDGAKGGTAEPPFIRLNMPMPTVPIRTIKLEDFYPWQKELYEIFRQPCPWDDRTIYWRYGDANIGKTQFAKWCCIHLRAVVLGGTAKHMLAQAQNAKAGFYIILLSYGDEIVSYRAIEQIKDGLFSTGFGCDNNRMEITNAPHILIIGNEAPDRNDRHFHPGKYNVKEI